ncbi:hypothetical protein KC19_3G015900 [Ceratodon purpureus]|uniref:Uncharacterized protein n=1 Tax=Ceratodon purpureus TaxID=3225 RepID=A0A8T0IG44_CERPU|nr:hypothetical protein KC19_3G015900 [Ceratodon purpureus]
MNTRSTQTSSQSSQRARPRENYTQNQRHLKKLLMLGYNRYSMQIEKQEPDTINRENVSLHPRPCDIQTHGTHRNTIVLSDLNQNISLKSHSTTIERCSTQETIKMHNGILKPPERRATSLLLPKHFTHLVLPIPRHRSNTGAEWGQTHTQTPNNITPTMCKPVHNSRITHQA